MRLNITRQLCTVLAVILLSSLAHAESCTSSREYILTNSFGELPQSPQSYQDLFKMCLQTLQLSNVEDAYLLKDGAVAVIPRDDGIIATASTLARFCERYPSGRLRFINRGERAHILTVGQIVKLSSTGATSCQDINRERY